MMRRVENGNEWVETKKWATSNQNVGILAIQPRSHEDTKNHKGYIFDKIKLRAPLCLRAFVAKVTGFTYSTRTSP